MIKDLEDGEVITINEYRQLYDELEPGLDGEGYFIKDQKQVTDDEVTYSKVFNRDYIAENRYSHIAWYPFK